MMGIRQTTCTDIALVEIGVPGAVAEIRTTQKEFLLKMMARRTYRGSYLDRIITQAIACRTKSGIIIEDILLHPNTDFASDALESAKHRLLSSPTSKRVTYCELNPELHVHDVYTAHDIPEHHRIAFTRLRTSSHNLKIETGRWARIPRELRTCACSASQLQTEEHMILTCPLLNDVRLPQLTSVSDFFDSDARAISHFCYVLQTRSNV